MGMLVLAAALLALASYTSGIVDILKKQQDVRIYAPNGKPLKHLQKGVNIIRMNDGTVRKLLVK